MKKFSLPKDGGLIEAGLPNGIKHTFERIPAHIYEDEVDASERLAEKIVASINSADGVFRLGLTTGSSPVALYKALVRYYKEGKVSFRNVEIFSIDEYYPAPADHYSRNRRLYEDLVAHVDIAPENAHVPKLEEVHDSAYVTEFCAQYDAKARGLDLLIMGMGEKGQIGFNEAGASEQSRTRTVLLPYSSRKRQARNFAGMVEETPNSAIAMGISTMMSAKKIHLIAWGEDKASVVKMVAEDAADPSCPASLLQKHDNISFYVDENSASLLTRNVAPWLVGPCEWTPKFIRKAVVWLCEQVHKPILKLTQGDYLSNGLGELLEQHGPYSDINIKVFKHFHKRTDARDKFFSRFAAKALIAAARLDFFSCTFAHVCMFHARQRADSHFAQKRGFLIRQVRQSLLRRSISSLQVACKHAVKANTR